MYKIFLVEDDFSLADAVKSLLESYGSEVTAVKDFRNVTAEFTEAKPHLVLMDIKLPFKDGYFWTSEIRKISSVPIVFLSSASDNMNIIMAINMGADDFIPKPVDAMVLNAKVNAILRRTYEITSNSQTVDFYGATLHLSDYTVTYSGKRTELTKNEFRILQILLDNRGKIVSRDTGCYHYKAGSGVYYKVKRKVFAYCLRKNKIAVILFILMTALNGVVFLLYDIMTEAFFYAESLTLVTFLMLIGIDFTGELKAAKRRSDLKKSILLQSCFESVDADIRDEDYCEMLALLSDELNRLQTDFSLKKQADNDYYTAWVHQIKTPIATMKLLLSQNAEENKELSAELFRIEQYVEMVLSYIRLESDSNDLVIKAYSLDELIRETVRKFAPQFIAKRLKLNYEPTNKTAVTDKKWLMFILEQLISNAVKYTPEGEITISVEGNTVKISDTGIGIAPEDIPRIFEKGYTGANGRLGQKSSGLGLFLSKKAASLISAGISVQSIPGSGTEFSVILPGEKKMQTLL